MRGAHDILDRLPPRFRRIGVDLVDAICVDTPRRDGVYRHPVSSDFGRQRLRPADERRPDRVGDAEIRDRLNDCLLYTSDAADE